MIVLVLLSIASATVLLAGVPAVAFALALEACALPGPRQVPLEAKSDPAGMRAPQLS